MATLSPRNSLWSGDPSSPLSPKDLLNFIARIENRRPLDAVVRIDAVEIATKNTGDGDYQNLHPLIKEYRKFVEWLLEAKKEERAAGRIIISPRGISVTKPPESERPILVKTAYDPDPKVLQEHYYTAIISGGFPEYPVKFTANRVFCVEELMSELRAKWNELSGQKGGAIPITR